MTHEATSPEAEFPLTLEGNIAFWEQRVNRLEAEAPSIAGSNQYPEWFFQDNERLREIVPQLKAEGADLSNAAKYYELLAKEAELRSVITGYPQYNHPMQQLAYNLGEDFMGKALKAEPLDGTLHRALIDDLSQATEQTSGALAPELNVLKEAYGMQTVTELLGIGGDEFSDKLRGLLLRSRSIHWIRFMDEERGDGFKLHERQEASRVWMSKAVEAASGMPAAEASDYVFSASRRAEDADIISIIEKFDHFGIVRIRALTKATGLRGLEAYSTEQLERMEEFINDSAKVAERLADHDVIAVMVNRVGDRNGVGVLHNVAANFDDENMRVLFFEINSLDDIYKRMITLHKAGIKPATLVLAAHSAPGQFMVSDFREKTARRRDIATVAGRNLVAMMNSNGKLDPGDFSYSMHGMKGMARLVETYMQPSRAIDDTDDDKGREKIIFQACHSSSEVKSDDADDSGKQVQTGLQSVISQLGSDLIELGVKSKVDIYGASGGIQLQKNGRGVHYTGQPTSFERAIEGEGRPHLAAQRIRISGGVLTKEEVHDIPLRKTA
jgi:hypothetical protein